MALIPLSTQGNTDFRDDRKIYAAAAQRFSDQDTDCLDHLYKHLSLASHTSIKTHPAYAAYQLLAIENRSYQFYSITRDIPSIGNIGRDYTQT